MTDQAFDRAWSFLQRPDVEGGGVLVDDPNDPGGLTHWGISQRAFPNVDIASLTENDARGLFRTYYWEPCWCDRLPERIAVALADCAFNQGVRKAIGCLQLALHVEHDGIMGPETLGAALNAYPGDLILDFLSWRAVEYSDGKRVFRRGWYRRLFLLQLALMDAE